MDRQGYFDDLIPPGNGRFQGRAIPPGFVMGDRQLPPLPEGYRLLTDAEVGIEEVGIEKKFTLDDTCRCGWPSRFTAA
jgi:hypothetical protein